jgi:hypothetical protein
MAERKVFYFVAQRGAISDRPMRADNFYQYTIPEFYRGQVLAEVETAWLSESGLQYSLGFLKTLEKWDAEGLKGFGQYIVGDGSKGDQIITALVDILGPLPGVERASILAALIDYRTHWFQEPAVRGAIKRIPKK